MGSIAAETRRAVDRTPYLRRALRAGVLNYTAAARELDVAGETDAVASALRRYADELPALEPHTSRVSVRMERNTDKGVTVLGQASAAESPTAISLRGDIDPGRFGNAIWALSVSDVPVLGAGTVGEAAVVLVPRGDGPTALRLVEDVLDRD
ncbi:DUF7523 family protein [Halodesulfurarchaeum formicicum]|uniref:Uncharacterized protein n=1 Tax=Halodesulfurarchaeum formicicum TaxID=1873524 RepID=A0A1J1AD32_9EURY|nr:hypothetical protein [Halodesulfurarchaeum formicicum]APE95797.1 hypothetical protein HSR6_1354 [Halodesulfurarchaeum formicicum]